MKNGHAGNGDNLRSICIVLPYQPSLTETFIRGHVRDLPAKVVSVHGWRPSIEDRPLLSLPTLAGYKFRRMLTGQGLERETTAAYLKAFRSHGVEAVLAEYGEMGVLSLEACRIAGVPLIVHFHGYDASVHSVLKQHEETYPIMFAGASAIVAVSRAMQRKLISLGADPRKVHYNPYGVDCTKFGGADPANAPPLFVAVGRLTEKKAPQNTLRAFAQVYRAYPAARLRMVGTGPLEEECTQLVDQLGIAEAVTFLGGQPADVVQQELQQGRCYVQHSIEAPSGDSEGTPVSILEACATGLPIVSTRHAGIPDVVIEEETGLLVDEGDIEGMARQMLRLAEDPHLAGKMGESGRARIQAHFSKEKSVAGLWQIIEACIKGKPLDATDSVAPRVNPDSTPSS